MRTEKSVLFQSDESRIFKILSLSAGPCEILRAFTELPARDHDQSKPSDGVYREFTGPLDQQFRTWTCPSAKGYALRQVGGDVKAQAKPLYQGLKKGAVSWRLPGIEIPSVACDTEKEDY